MEGYLGANVTDVRVNCSSYVSYARYCIVDTGTGTLTGYCMDLSTCAIGPSAFCSPGGAFNPPTVQAYCGPTLDYTMCWY